MTARPAHERHPRWPAQFDAASVLIVGLGSAHGDDQFGWRVIEALAAEGAIAAGVALRKAAAPTDLLDWIDGVDRLLLCDAFATGAAGGGSACNRSGPVMRFEMRAGDSQETVFPELQRLRSCGSHQFGLPAVLDLAAKLGRLPRQIVVFAAEGREFLPGSDLSPELQRLLPETTRLIREETHARAVAGAVAALAD